MQIAILVYEGFDELDVLGPYEVLANASSAGAEVKALLASSNSSMSQVTGSHGVTVIPHTTIYDGPFDIVVVPGGGYNEHARAGAYAEILRGDVAQTLRDLHGAGCCVASVCTGAMLVSAAGLFRRRPATTHHRALQDLKAQGAQIVDARVVDDGDLLSCGGVTSGIDLALWILERFFSPELADRIAKQMEHERRGPLFRNRLGPFGSTGNRTETG
jgi:transcriptional regulator GlxA family with amidase domain